MNKVTFNLIILCMCFFINSCSNKKNPSPDQNSNQIPQSDSYTSNIDSVIILQKKQFYELENSIKDVKNEISILQSKVMDYEYQERTDDYSKKLKELIDRPPPSHRILLNNESIIEGIIEKDNQYSILVSTGMGKISINKSDINTVEDLVLPVPEIVFLGHGNEEILENFRIFSGKIINKGSRRGDFVRVVYNLWDENTELILSDSAFVGGSQIIYSSGIITDTILEPNQSANFSIQFSIADTINVAYVTRNIHWEIYD